MKVAPPWITETFGGNGFFVFGRLAFNYATQDGKIWQCQSHWLEAMNGIILPERPDPVSFTVYLKPGVQMTWLVDAGIDTTGAGLQIGNNIATAIGGKLAQIGL